MQRIITGLVAILSILILVSATPTKDTKPEKRPRVEIRTELGNMVVELYNETPQHRDNFLKLVKEGFYDSLLWHRIIPAFMVRGGDPNSKHAAPGLALGSGGPGYTVPAEIVPGLIHKKGALAAARQSDQVNPARASSGSQFYIVQGKPFTEQELDMISKRSAGMGTPVTYTAEQKRIYSTAGGAPHLDGAYTIFGEVVEGLEVIDLLSAVERQPGDRPVKDVHMWMSVAK